MVSTKLLNPNKLLPGWVAPTLTIFFAILWGVWLLPHTVFIRHTAMVLGAILGLYVCALNGQLFLKKEAFSIYVILFLIGWVTLHFFIIGPNYALQFQELTGVWKKVMICIPFALGLGIAIGQSKQKNLCWNLLYFGLTLPTLIFFGKWVLTTNAIEWNIQSPYLLLNPHYSQPFGISRALYPFYCLPSFVIALYLIINGRLILGKMAPLYLASIFLTPLLFFLEGDRTGLLLVTFFSFLNVLVFLSRSFKIFKLKPFLIVCAFTFFSVLTLFAFFIKFKQSNLVFSNVQIAINIDQSDHWKYQGAHGLPKNIKGLAIDESTYLRVSWFIAGSRLLSENPLGYGLLTLSFDHLSKNKWPGSILSMTHSGFLDFALGYGYLGIGLLLAASFGAIWKSYFFSANWNSLFWGFGVLFLVMLFKELSYEITVNAYIFFILIISGLGLSFLTMNNSEVTK
jgi:hypothetical protein